MTGARARVEPAADIDLDGERLSGGPEGPGGGGDRAHGPRRRGRPAAASALLAGAALVLGCGRDESQGTGEPPEAPLDGVARDGRVDYLLDPGARFDHYDVNTSDVLPILRHSLEHGNRDTLRRSKQELAELGPEGLEVAVRLGHDYWNRPDRTALLRNALDVALLSDDPGAADFLKEAAGHPLEDLRLLAVEGLARCGGSRDWDVLRAALDLSSPTYFPRVVASMYELDLDRTAGVVLGWVEAGDFEPLWGDLMAPFARVEDPTLVERFCELWPELLDRYALWPAAACAAAGSAQAREVLQAWSESEDAALRGHAYLALSHAGLVEPLVAAFASDPSDANRLLLAGLLSSDPERLKGARDAVFTGISDPNREVATTCLRNLIDHGDPAAIEHAFEILGEADGAGVREAMQVLGQRLWSDPELARRAYTVLAEVLADLRHRPVEERALVLSSLGRLPLAASAERLLALVDGCAGESIQGLRAPHWLTLQAGNVGEAAHGLLLERLAGERDPVRRLDLLEALSLRGGTAARDRLLALVDGEVLGPYELLYVADRLVRIGPTAAVAPVLKRATLRVQKDDVRRALQGLLWRSYPAPSS